MIKVIDLLISDEFCVSKIQLFFLKDRYKKYLGYGLN
jgi:hypothetical protein